MTHPKKLLSTASILALTLTLSACGNSSNDNADMMPAPPDPLKVANELTALSGDAEAAGSALKKATDAANKISPIGSNGDSNVAMMNAQAVLNAKMELEDAKSAAMTVLEDLPDTPENAAERELLTQAIADAEEREGALLAELQKVTGTDEDEPKTPGDRRAEVAKAVLDAFDAGTSRIRRESLFPTSFDATPTQTDVTRMTSSVGETFEEIVDFDVMYLPLGHDGELVPTISGDAEGVRLKFAQHVPGHGYRIGHELTAVFNGIDGYLMCNGADCEAEGSKHMGNWVFTPADQLEPYIDLHYMENEDGTYADVPYVEYGHWLSEANGDVTIHTAANLSDDDVHPINTEEKHTRFWEDDVPEAGSATYSGNAAGRSVHREFDSDGVATAAHSGSFTADVSLTATFGDNPTLEGKVSGFEAVDNPRAVDTDWEVTLEETGVVGGGITDANFGEGGNLWARSYVDGEESTRPDGIYGHFEAEFTDGQAAGAYATRKDAD